MRRDELEALDVISLAALLAHAEAGNQGPIGMLAVLHVAINRSKAERVHYGRGLRGVMLQPNHFRSFAEGNIGRLQMGHVGEGARAIASLAINLLTLSPVGRATDYHGLNEKPDWADSPTMEFVSQLGDHLFYREI